MNHNTENNHSETEPSEVTTNSQVEPETKVEEQIEVEAVVTEETEEAAAEESQEEAAVETEQAIGEEKEKEAVAETSEDEIITGLIEELSQARRAADEAQDHALRARAELQNFRRRKEREANDRIAQANARLLLELLPVIDDFELAFDNVPESVEAEQASWVEGFQLILRKLQAVLEREGVTPIDATGAFDPNVHEAISMEPNDEVPSGEIIAEVRRGYMLDGKVLRPSFVRVSQ